MRATTINVEIQHVTTELAVPTDQEITQWAEVALNQYAAPAEICIRIVDSTESQALNLQYRQQDKPTNVLSFPSELPDNIDLRLLGDIVLCAPLVREEANQQGKSVSAHWAHLVIHGILHLLGYDHIKPQDAEKMESLEIQLLQQLAFPNPYENSNE